MSPLVLAFGALGVAFFGIVLLEALVRRSTLAAGLLLFLTVVEVTLREPLSVPLEALTIYATDMLSAALLAATAARLLRLGRLTVLQRWLLLFGLLALFSLARGALEFGLQPAGNEFRKFFAFASAGLYFSTVPAIREHYDRIALVWLAASAFFLGLALFRWGALAAGLSGGVYGPGGTMRVMVAAETLLLVQAFFITLPLWRRHPWPPLRWAAPALLAAVVLLQHRTVWAIVLTGIALYALQDRAIRKSLVYLVATALVAGLVLSVAFFDDGQRGATEQLSGSATNPDTLAWRYEGWQDLLSDSGPDGVYEFLVGQPFGTGWDRRISGQTIEVSPHNFYIESYLRVGVVGAAALVLLYATAARRLRRAGPGSSAHDAHSSPSELMPARLLLVLLVTQITYFLTYAPDFPQGILFGLMIGAAAARVRRPVPTAAPAALENAAR